MMAQQTANGSPLASTSAEPLLRGHDRYPLNIDQTDSFPHALQSYQRRLNQEKVFHDKFRLCYLWDLKKIDDDSSQPIHDFVASSNLRTGADVNKYLASQGRDPFWRFIFVNSNTSRGALGCTKEHVTLLFTHHQVMPSFLDHVFTFKSRSEPYTHAAFRHDNDFFESVQPRIQHAFNLIGIEENTESVKQGAWYPRQTALYHSFDIRSGKCVWFVLKGNRVMRDYLKQDVEDHPLMKASALTSPESSFAASLQVHLIVLRWSVEGWSEYLDMLENEVEETSQTGKLSPVAEATTPKNISRRASLRSTTSKRNSFPQESPQTPISTSRPGSPFRRVSFPQFTRSLTDVVRHIRGSSSGSFSGLTAVDGDDDDEIELDFDMEKHFSIDKLQDLTYLGDNIQSKLHILAQNRAVINELVEQYESVAASPEFELGFQDVGKCKSHLGLFYRQTKAVIRDVDQYHSRLSALLHTVENSKALLQSILQDKSEKTSSVFAKSAYDSSNRMETWTKKMHTLTIKTKHETLSMHVITIFTLLFLPGTFLAVSTLLAQPPPPAAHENATSAILTQAQTFFSSGVLHWDEESPVHGDYAPRGGALTLFFSICIPMMVVILAGWLWMMRRMKKDLADEESSVGVEPDLGEKGKVAPHDEAGPVSPEPAETGLGIRSDTMVSIKE